MIQRAHVVDGLSGGFQERFQPRLDGHQALDHLGVDDKVGDRVGVIGCATKDVVIS